MCSPNENYPRSCVSQLNLTYLKTLCESRFSLSLLSYVVYEFMSQSLTFEIKVHWYLTTFLCLTEQPESLEEIRNIFWKGHVVKVKHVRFHIKNEDDKPWTILLIKCILPGKSILPVRPVCKVKRQTLTPSCQVEKSSKTSVVYICQKLETWDYPYYTVTILSDPTLLKRWPFL